MPQRENIIKNECKLDNGEIREYDACSDNKRAYNAKHFKLIGRGTVYSVNGVLQEFTHKQYFFTKKFMNRLEV